MDMNETEQPSASDVSALEHSNALSSSNALKNNFKERTALSEISTQNNKAPSKSNSISKNISADVSCCSTGSLTSIVADNITCDKLSEENLSPLSRISTGLAEYLNINPIGREVKREYSNNNEILKPTTRSKLVRLVIRREKDYQMRNISADDQLSKFIITPKRFLILSQEICTIFKHESPSIYYIPFKKIGNTEIPISGKLWDHFNYEKKRLRDIGLVAAVSRKHEDKVPNVHEITEEEQEKLDWLKYNVDDWTTVTQYWNDTFQARQKQLLVEKVSTEEYINSYLCLQIESGHLLIEKDFATLQPTSKLIAAADWIILKDCLKVSLRGLQKKICVEDRALILTLLSNLLVGDKEDFLIFYLLPYVITSTRAPKRRSKTLDDQTDENSTRPVKLSIQERRETFILHSQTASDFKLSVRNLQTKLKKIGQPFQPVIVAIGELTNINEYFVVINEEYYKKKNCLEAISLALKIFFVFDCNYSQASLTLWLFVQKCLFNLDLPIDVNNLSLNVLRAQFEEKLKQNN